jgi:hypothetical protein
MPAFRRQLEGREAESIAPRRAALQIVQFAGLFHQTAGVLIVFQCFWFVTLHSPPQHCTAIQSAPPPPPSLSLARAITSPLLTTLSHG